MTMKHFNEEKEEMYPFCYLIFFKIYYVYIILLFCWSTANGPRSYTIKQALRSIDFYILWFIVFLDIIPVVLLTSTYKV